LALGNRLKSAATLVVGGILGVVLAPALAPALTGLMRPAVKAGIKAGLLLFERGQLAAAELRESLEDITAEVQAELAAGRAPEQPPGDAAGSVEVISAASREIVH
jgi:Protein of unknown function (DUF5132)